MAKSRVSERFIEIFRVGRRFQPDSAEGTMLVAGDVSHRLMRSITIQSPEGTACFAADYMASRWDSCRVAAFVPVIYACPELAERVTGY